MKTSLRKLFVQFLLIPSVLLFSSVQAQAGVLDWLKLIESAVPPGTLPFTIAEAESVIKVLDSCQDTSEEGIMQCVDAVDASSGGGGDDHVKQLIQIIFDLKNSDYVQLMKDGGEVVGCAAAQIITGFDVCGAIKALIAVGEAVADALGEAGDVAAGWLNDLDYALTGPTPHQSPDDYFKNAWMAYISDYVAKGAAGSVSDAIPITPYLPQYYFNQGGSYAEYGLTTKSMAAAYSDCVSYYNGFHDSNATSNCNTVSSRFHARTTFLISAAKQMNTFGKSAKIELAGLQTLWRGKFQAVDDTYGSNIEKDFNGSYNTKYLQKAIKLIGEVQEDTYCPSPGVGCVEKFDSYSGKPTGSIAQKAFDAVYESNFKTQPQAALDTARKNAEPQLQKLVDDYKKDQLKSAQDKISSVNYAKLITLHNAAKDAFNAMKKTCSSLGTDFGAQTTANRCLTTEPFPSCAAYVDALHVSVDTANDKVVEAYIASVKPGIAWCTDISQTVVSDWQRMNKLYAPFKDGWSAVCKTKTNQNTMCDLTLGNALEIAYDNCAAKDVADTIAKWSTSGKPKVLTYSPFTANVSVAGKIDFKPALPGQGQKSAASYNIAESFCADSGLGAVNDVVQSMQPVAPSKPTPTDPAKRDPAKVAATAQVVTNTKNDCKYGSTGSGKQDVFRLTCSSKASYDACIASFSGADRPGTCNTANGDADGYVLWPCCTLVPAGTKKFDEVGAGASSTPIGGTIKKDTGKVEFSAPLGTPLNPAGNAGTNDDKAMPLKTTPRAVTTTTLTMNTLPPPPPPIPGKEQKYRAASAPAVAEQAGKGDKTAVILVQPPQDVPLELKTKGCVANPAKPGSYDCKAEEGLKFCLGFKNDKKVGDCRKTN